MEEVGGGFYLFTHIYIFEDCFFPFKIAKLEAEKREIREVKREIREVKKRN